MVTTGLKQIYVLECGLQTKSGQFKVAYYSILMKEIRILKSVKLKQQDISSEVLVTAIDVKCNFTENQG